MRLARSTLVILGFLAAWEGLSRSGFVSVALFPPPTRVMVALWDMVVNGGLARDTMLSLSRLFAGVAVGVTVAVTVGLLTGSIPRLAVIIEPLVQLLRPVPPVAIIPLVIIWLGIGNVAKIFSIGFAVFFPVWLNTHSGVRRVPQRLIWSAATPVFVRSRILWEVAFPSAMPFIIAGIRTAISVAFIMIFVSEYGSASSGLGYVISVSYLAFRIDRMLAALIVLASLGALADYGFTLLVARAFPWLAGSLRNDESRTQANFSLPNLGESEQVSNGDVSLKNVSVAYGETSVLRNIDLTIQRGQFLAVVGLSGSGKTSLINAIAGFISHDGVVARPQRVGVVFQDHAAFDWLSTKRNIAFGLFSSRKDDRWFPIRSLGTRHANNVPSAGLWNRLFKRDPGAAKHVQDVVDRQLAMARLEGLGDRYPGELSGGQVQRLGLARANSPDPDLILLDEPFASLDRHTRERMQEWLLEVWSASHKTIVFVTHDIEEAIFLADRVIALRDGRIAAEFSVAYDRPRNEHLKFDQSFADLRWRILNAIRPTASGSPSGPNLAEVDQALVNTL